jgi:hypothetical protein
MLPYCIGCGKKLINHLYFDGHSFQYNDVKLTFEIPQNEVLNNLFINCSIE